MIETRELEKYLNQILNPNQFNDYCPNGLQVEGKEKCKKIAFAVSATKSSINEAIKQKADCLIVHHGVFWKYKGAQPIIGPFAKRVIPLIENKINLFAYHLPLDANMEVGNAVSIANELDLADIEPFAEYKENHLGVKGKFKNPIGANELSKKLKIILDHDIILACPNETATLKSIGIITGGANNEWTYALQDKLDAYLTGEISEYNWHDSQEAGIHMFAGGHHATERFGVKALAKKIEKDFNNIETIFIDSPNPV